MFIRNYLIYALLLFFIAGNAQEQLPPIWQATTPLLIPCGQNKSSSLVQSIPPIPRKDGFSPVLIFDAGIDFDRPRGWSHMLEFKINGKPVTAYTRQGSLRLLNRGYSLINHIESPRQWWNKNRLLTLYGPVGGELHPKIISSRDEGYTYKIALDNLLESNQNNQLEIINHLTSKIMKSAQKRALQLANLRIELFPDETIEKMRSFDPVSKNNYRSKREKIGYKFPKDYHINCLENSKSNLYLNFPALKKEPGTVPVLAFDGYLYMPHHGGWNCYMELELNGKKLSRYLNNGDERLLCRGDKMVTTDPKQPVRSWWEGNTILMIFGPGCGEIAPSIRLPRMEGYSYYFDISDLVNHINYGPDQRIESAVPNKINIINNLTRKHIGGRHSFLGVRNLRIVNIPEKLISQYRGNRMTTWNKLDDHSKKITINQITLCVAPNGGIEISKGGDSFRIQSGFSYVAQPQMKFNQLDFQTKATGEKTWNPVITNSSNEINISARGSKYTLWRKIIHFGTHLEIRDKITNHFHEPLGIKYINSIIYPQKLDNKQIYLAGISNVTYNDGIGDNPTVYVSGKHSGLGIMALDDLFRNHMKTLKSSANTVDYLDENSALRPGKSYEYTTKVFLTTSNDYFEFLNTLRRHLKREQTIDYFLGFSDLRSEQLNFNLFTNDPWFEWVIRGAKNYTRTQYFQLMNEKRRTLQQRYPQAKIMAKMETNIVMIDKSEIKDGHKLPPSLTIDKKGNRHYGAYGYVCSKEQTNILLENCKFSDSLLFTEKNCAKVDGYYSAEPRLNLLVQVEEGNSRFKNIMEQIDFLLNEAKVDGIYMDQFEAGCTGSITRPDRCSYNRWDGWSVDLDAYGNISRKFYDYALMGISGRQAIVKRVTDNGKIFWSNNHPTSEKTATLPAYHFHEMEFYPIHASSWNKNGEPDPLYILGKCQLSNTPLTLGIRPMLYTKDKSQHAKYIQKAIIWALRHGIIYVPYHCNLDKNSGIGMLNDIYPITPQELGKGFMVGKERILSAVSKDFILEKIPVAIKKFDINGNAIKDNSTIIQKNGKWIIKLRLKDWQESAVIIR